VPVSSHKRKPGHVALERALSKLGIASRTKAREWILAGKVRVNGKVETRPLFSVWPEKARIEIEGEKVAAASPLTLLLYKPKGIITTHSDEKGRKTVFSLLPEKISKQAGHLIAVGRLDRATTGLLILTNDTRLSAWLTDPVNEVRRVYLVTVRGEVTESELGTLRKGVLEQGEKLLPDAVVLRKASRKESHLTVTLTEGKNREIRRLFASLNHEVTRLKRVSYGSLELGELKPGDCRILSLDELKAAFSGAPLRG